MKRVIHKYSGQILIKAIAVAVAFSVLTGCAEKIYNDGRYIGDTGGLNTPPNRSG